MPAYPKAPKPVRSEPYRRLVASLPCIRCGMEGASQAAHANSGGKAKGAKNCDLTCFPLCHVGANGCHAAWDQYKCGGRDAQAELEPIYADATQTVLLAHARHDLSIARVLRAVGLLG